jgi:hypothetical protein
VQNLHPHCLGWHFNIIKQVCVVYCSAIVEISKQSFWYALIQICCTHPIMLLVLFPFGCVNSKTRNNMHRLTTLVIQYIYH